MENIYSNNNQLDKYMKLDSESCEKFRKYSKRKLERELSKYGSFERVGARDRD